MRPVRIGLTDKGVYKSLQVGGTGFGTASVARRVRPVGPGWPTGLRDGGLGRVGC